jgi:hypothetical protein
MGGFPYMKPSAIKFIPSNAAANITAQPLFTAVGKTYITGASVVHSGAVVGDDTDYIAISLIQLANASNVVATINFKTGVNSVANAAADLTLNSTLNPVASGTVLGLTVLFGTTANINLGTMAMYQIDYVQGSPASEG